MKRIIAVFGLMLGAVVVASAQIQPPSDVVPNHISISGQFAGYDSGGKMVSANLDIVQLPVTKHFTADYDHISIPGIGQRWELGNVSYQNKFPKIKAVVWDTSKLQYQASAGLGKFLSSVGDGNHLAWDVAGAIQYPVTKLMGWQLVRFQYVYAIGTGGIHGTISNTEISTGPVLRF